MQCTSYSPGGYYLRDNVGLGGCSWPTANSNIVWNNGHGFNVLMPPPTMDHDLGPQREICRQMMLKHESTFKYQVYELHRLYRRQKELMEETRNREPLEHSFKLPFVSKTMSEISMETCWPSRNVAGIVLSLLSTQMFQEASSFIAGDSERRATDKLATKDDFEGCQDLSSQGNKCRKRMRTLDLELPGDVYIDSEEENNVQESKLDSFYPENSSVSDSSYRKTNILFDLNEPPQPDESDLPSSSSPLESDSSRHDIVNQNPDLSGKEKSTADCFLPENEALPDSTIREGHYDACHISPPIEKDDEIEQLPCNFQAGDDGSNLTSSAEASCCPKPGNPHKRKPTLDSTMFERNHDEANIEVPPVSSRRKFICDSKEFPVVVQALPCINNTSLNKWYKSCISNLRLSGRKFNPKKIKPAISQLTRDVKVPDCLNFPEAMDLSLVPANNLCDAGDKETDSSGKYQAVESSLDRIPNKQQKYGRDRKGNAGIDNKLSTTCTYSTERDLKAPVSPENRECSPPRAYSQETELERSIGSLKGARDQEEENDKLAADTLVFILSSGEQKYLNATIEQPEVSIGCLDWLAEIASTLANDQGKNVANSKVKYGTRKVKVVGIVKETGDASLPCRLKTEVAGLKKAKPELETKDRACSGRRRARSSHGKGMRSSKASKLTCSNLKQQNDGKQLCSAERFLKVWGSKKKRMGRSGRSTPSLAQIFGVPS